MSDQDKVEKRSTSPAGILIALGAVGLLLVLLMFRSSPTTDLPPDQGPIAMAVVNEMMTNGVLVDYDCSKNTAWVNRAVWTKYNFEQRRNMLIGLATVCETKRAGYRISILDTTTDRPSASAWDRGPTSTSGNPTLYKTREQNALRTRREARGW